MLSVREVKEKGKGREEGRGRGRGKAGERGRKGERGERGEKESNVSVCERESVYMYMWFPVHMLFMC